MSNFTCVKTTDPADEKRITPKFSVLDFSYDSFLSKINDGIISDIKIQDEILYGDYFNYDNFNNPKIRTTFQLLWTNKRFLLNLLNLLDTNKQFRDSVIKSNISTVNKIVYDYYVSENKDDAVCSILLDIAKVIDAPYIIKLSTVMNIEAARFIALARFSSFDLKECIIRFNTFIYRIGIDFSMKDIIYIYSTFFRESFSPLFNVTMQQIETNFENRTCKKVYDMMSLAILEILNSMTSADIYTVLLRYNNCIQLTNNNQCRFSLRSLSDDYYRINMVVEELSNRGIYIL